VWKNVLLTLILAATSARLATADDWPQWMGRGRDSVWREDGIVDAFPRGGLPVKWRVPIAGGYAGPAVADGRVYVMDYVRRSGQITNVSTKRDNLEGTERVLCFSAATGGLLWKHEYDRRYRIAYAQGPRCTPAVDSGRVYALGAQGDLFCLDAVKGTVLWQKSFTRDYAARIPLWGAACHPLVDGDLVYCVVGGRGCLVMAFNKVTGKEVWRALYSREIGYCPPTLIEHAGHKQLLIWYPDGLSSLDPLTGKLNWTTPLKAQFTMSVAAPRKLGDKLFVSGNGNVGALYQLADDPKSAPRVVWEPSVKSALFSTNSTPFLEDGILYGVDSSSGALIAAQLSDGKRLWQTFAPAAGGDRPTKHGTAFLVKQGDRFFLFSETGDLILAKLSREGYREISRFHVLDPTLEVMDRHVVWSHPAFANRCVFARNDKELVCVDLAAPK